jgi:hypothetical protein
MHYLVPMLCDTLVGIAAGTVALAVYLIAKKSWNRLRVSTKPLPSGSSE